MTDALPIICLAAILIYAAINAVYRLAMMWILTRRGADPELAKKFLENKDESP